MDVIYYDRAAWGADPAHPRRGGFVAPEQREGLVLHHTVGGRLLSFSIASALTYVRWLQTGVTRRLGADIPYSFVPCLIRIDGEFSVLLCEGRGWFRSGAHTVDTIVDDDPIENENRALLGEGWQGDWRTYETVLGPYGDPDTILDDAVSSVGGYLGEQAGIEIPDHNITYAFGHRDFKKTSCPSDGMYARKQLLLDSFQEATMGYSFEKKDQRDFFADLYEAYQGAPLPAHPGDRDGQAISPKARREFDEALRFFFDGLGLDLRGDAAVQKAGDAIKNTVADLAAHLKNHPSGGATKPHVHDGGLTGPPQD